MANSRLNIIITATDQASRALGAVGGGVERLGGAAAGLGNIATAAVGGVAALGAGAVALGGAAAALAIDAAPLENVQAAFDGITAAAGTTGAAVLSSMQDASNGMIAMEDLMLTFNSASQLVSPDFALQLTDALGPLGRVASATGQDLDFLMDSLVTGVGRMSAPILDNLAIQVDIAAANEAYAESLGITVGEMTKQQQQAALMAQVLDKLNENTAAMPDTADSAAASIARFQAMMKDTKDTIGLAFIPIITELAAAIMPLVQQAIPPLADAAERLGLILAGALSQGLAMAGDLFNNLQNMIGGDSPMAAAFQSVAEGAAELFAAFEASAPAAQEVIESFLAWFGENMAPTIANIVGNVGVILSSLADLWSKHGDSIMRIVGGAFRVLAVTIGGALNLISGIVSTVLAFISGDWQLATDTIRATLTNFLDSALSLVGTNLDEFVGVWRTNFELLKTIVSETWSNLTEGVGEFFAGLQETIGEKIQGVIDSVRGFFTDFVDLGANMIAGISEGISGAIQGLIDSMIQAVGGGLDAVRDFLGIQSPSKVFAEVGQNITAGLAGGISGGASMVSAATGDLAVATVGGFAGASGSGAGSGGGRSVQFVYSPSLSTASESEAREAIAPVLRDLLFDFDL